MPDTERTSRQAYIKLLQSGELKTIRDELYEFIASHQDGVFWFRDTQYSYHGMISGGDVTRFFSEMKFKGLLPSGRQISSYRKRMGELVDDGSCYYTHATKISPETGAEVHGLRTTDPDDVAIGRVPGAKPSMFFLIYTADSMQIESFKSTKARLSFIVEHAIKAARLDKDDLHLLDVTKLGKATLKKWDPTRLRRTKKKAR